MEQVYISGKIGDEVISEATRLKFARAEEMLRAKGHEVFNPTSEKWQRTLRRTYEKDLKAESAWIEGTFPDLYTYCLLRDLMTLSTKDAIYLLEDWQQSPGAKAEYLFAVAAGKRIYFADRAQAVMAATGLNRKLEDIWLPIEGKEAEK